jgi:hypothetical protein
MKSMIRQALSLAILLSVLCSCEALGIGSSPKRVDWRWVQRTSYETTPGTGSKVFVSVKDIEEAQDINSGLQEGLKAKLEEQGLQIVSDPNEADYACYVYLRYFNRSPDKPKKGEEPIEESPGPDGQFGWQSPSGRVYDSPPVIAEIPPRGIVNQWDLLIDLAVGEKLSQKDGTSVFMLRWGRLLGHASGSRDDALWWFREGRPAPDPTDGVTPGPPRPVQPTS